MLNTFLALLHWFIWTAVLESNITEQDGKETVHAKMKHSKLSSFTHSNVVPNPYDYLFHAPKKIFYKCKPRFIFFYKNERQWPRTCKLFFEIVNWAKTTKVMFSRKKYFSLLTFSFKLNMLLVSLQKCEISCEIYNIFWKLFQIKFYRFLFSVRKNVTLTAKW